MSAHPRRRRVGLWRQLGMASLLSTAFGSGLVSIRLGVAHFPPLTFTALRLIIVVSSFGVLLAALGRRVRGDGRFFARLFLVGALGVGVPFITASFALRLISSTLFSILLNMTPVLSVVLAHVILPDEHLTRRTAAGVALAVVGASLVVWGSAGTARGRAVAEGHWGGVALTAVNTLSISLSNVLLRRWFRRDDIWTVSAVQLVAALALALPLALLFGLLLNARPVQAHLEQRLQTRLNESLLLFYTGVTRQAETILDEQQNRINESRMLLNEIKSMACAAKEELLAGNLDFLGKLLHESWMLKKQLASRISNPTIDAIYEAAIKAGAAGGKISGAGGGGFLLLYCPVGRREKVREALSKLVEVPFNLEVDGSKVIFNIRR